MSAERVERIANAVLYEGYILYPYRASSVKNRRRFNFGVLFPPAYCAMQEGTESSSMRTECLVCGGPEAEVDVKLRFLQVMPGSWQEAMERDVELKGCRLGDLTARGREEAFSEGVIDVTARLVEDGVYRLAIRVQNRAEVACTAEMSRDEMLPFAMAAAHTILSARGAVFVSLLDPPEELRPAVAECQNIGTWPVLAGEAGQRERMLSSPIILYDYPQIAPESPGDLFDGTEIDEILTLRIMTLTDDEKQEVRNGDERARRILERTELMPEEQFLKLHGVLRGLRPVEDAK